MVNPFVTIILGPCTSYLARGHCQVFSAMYACMYVFMHNLTFEIKGEGGRLCACFVRDAEEITLY